MQINLYLAILMKINLERLDVLLETQRAHGPQQIVAVDRLTLFTLTFITCFACDKTYELRYTFLNRLFCILCDFSVRRKCFLHDPADVCDWQETVLFADISTFVIIVFVDIWFIIVAHVYACAEQRWRLRFCFCVAEESH